jgi:hypothetical protein
MKTLLLFVLFFFNNINGRSQCKKNEIIIDIWKSDFSLAYTTYYHISSDSMFIKHIAGIVNEKDTLLLKKELTKNGKQTISDFISSSNFYSLKNEYMDSSVSDGVQMKIMIKSGIKVKTIIISNIYQNEVGSLISTLNKIIPKEYQIIYTKQLD